MADSPTVDNGSLTDIVVATDERTVGGVLSHVQRVDEIGSTAIATGQVVVTTTAATLVVARDSRKRVILSNNSSVDVYIGPATVTTVNGFRLAVGAAITLYTTALVQAIIAAGLTMTGNVDYLEEYDA